MKFTLKINSQNAALVDAPIEELVRILRNLAHALDVDGLAEDGHKGVIATGRLRDHNGNTVGTWQFRG